MGAGLEVRQPAVHLLSPNVATYELYTQSTTDRPIVVSAQNGPWICVNQYIIHIFMQCALKIIYVFSVIIHQNIDPKSTENPATWRTARMHDFGISIFCGQDHREKKHPHADADADCETTTTTETPTATATKKRPRTTSPTLQASGNRLRKRQ